MNYTKVLEKIAIFFNQFTKHYYQKDEILIRAGENPVGVFYLEKGYVRQYAISEKGEEITFNLYKPQTFFPMMWVLNDTPNNYYFEAAAASTVFIAPKEKVVAFVKNE
ncbi:cyclic nucleotide-binding domain-containing protein, partial [Candidatus Gottesmanbacteria bacterium]|nr:cyclic nucleotide-binding domain-containing protein [Candidatus Gottesmanbacteria bacterium]